MPDEPVHEPQPSEPRFADLLTAADRYSLDFAGAELSAVPARKLAIVTCMDARFDPIAAFDLVPGDVHIIRNAGARVSQDVMRSLIVSTIRLEVSRIAVVHHTECGANQISSTEMNLDVLAKTGAEPWGVDFMFFEDSRQTLDRDVKFIATCPFLPAGTEVAGFVFDVRTGRLKQTTDVLTCEAPPAAGHS